MERGSTHGKIVIFSIGRSVYIERRGIDTRTACNTMYTLSRIHSAGALLLLILLLLPASCYVKGVFLKVSRLLFTDSAAKII